MAVRGEEVASSIEAHVREAIERMVGEIRSSVDDVRVTVDSQLKAALQSVQADVNSITFLPHITKSIAELEQNLIADMPAPVAAAAPASPGGGANAGLLKRAIQAVERGKTQVDILNALLEQCLDFGSRAALLILRGETFSGWKGVGFSAHGGNDELIKRFNAAPGLIPELDRVLREETVVTWDGVNLSTRLGVGGATSAILVPMVIKDKVAAAVFIDATAEDAAKLDPASIQLLVFTTGLLVDTLSIRKKVPSPSLSGDDAGASASEAAPRAAAPAPAAAAPAPPPPPPVAPQPEPQPEVPEANATVSMTSAQMREVMQSQRPTFNMPAADEFSGASSVPQSAKATTPSAPPPPAAAPPPATGLGDSTESRPSTQYVPPTGVGRGGALGGGPQNEEAKRHDEARRFARLLVSEIKLYNEPKVDAGRKNRDLYERLKEDIDRSRQMYDERIPEDVRKTSNYFYDELVRILADGHAESLGL